MFAPRSNLIPNYAYLKAQAYIGNKSIVDAFHEAPKYLKHDIIGERFEKSAVSITNGEPFLNSRDVVAWVDTLKTQTFFSAAYDSFQRLPFDTRVVGASFGMRGAVVADGTTRPASNCSLGVTGLVRKQSTGLAVLSKEIIEAGGSSAVNAINSLLGSACGTALDEYVIEEILNHADTQNFNSSGSSAENFIADFRLMLDAVNVHGAGPLMWVSSRSAANRLNFDNVALAGVSPQGGDILGIPLVVSDGLIDDSAGGVLVLIDLRKIAANLDSMEVNVSQDALIEMNTAPTNPVDATAILTSLWQNNLVGFKASLAFGFEPLSGFRAASLRGIA